MNKIKAIVFGKGSSLAYALISLVMTIVPEDIFKYIKLNNYWSDEIIVLFNRVVLSIAIFLLMRIGYGLYYTYRRRVKISGDNFDIYVQYDNILKMKNGKRVINFDECYTTDVGDAPGDIKIETLCGQYLKEHKDLEIRDIIAASGIKPLKTASKYKNQERYESGLIAPNGDDFLMAFAKLDKEGRGCMTYGEYINCLNKLWEQIDLYHGTKDVYVPVLGSNITRFMDCDLTQQQLLDIMIASYRLSKRKLRRPYSLHIVCKEREDFSINKVFGVE